MKTQKSVIKKILEIENLQKLSSQKVELATIKDIQKWLGVLEKDLKAARAYKSDYSMKITQAKKEAINSIEQWIKADPVISVGNVPEGHIKDVIATGKELGVDMKKNPDVQRLQARIDDVKQMNIDIQKMKRDAETEIKKLR